MTLEERKAYWAAIRQRAAEVGINYNTVKSRIARGLDPELALIKNPYDFVEKKPKEKKIKKHKPMTYWIVRNNEIIKEIR